MSGTSRISREAYVRFCEGLGVQIPGSTRQLHRPTRRVSVVRCLANLCAHCETRNRAAPAPSGVAEVLAPAFKSRRKAGAPPNCSGTEDLDTSHDHREPIL